MKTMEKTPKSRDINIFYGDGTICAFGGALGHFCLYCTESLADGIVELGFAGFLVVAGLLGGIWYLDAEFGGVKSKRNGPFWITAAKIVLFILIGMVLFFLRSWVGGLTIFIAVWVLFRLKILEMKTKTQLGPAKEEHHHAEAEKQ